MLNEIAPLDRVFQALADPTRLMMVERLSRRPASVSELAKPLSMSLPAVFQHLQVCHRFLRGFGSSSCCARKTPRRSRRRSQLARRAATQSSTVRSALGSIRQVRTRPTFSERTRPLASSTR
jgi:DNA-binding transcriptional ArsR family regulator